MMIIMDSLCIIGLLCIFNIYCVCVSTDHNHLTEELGDVYAMSHTGDDPLQGMEVLLRVLLDLGTLKQASSSVKQ